MQSSPNGEPEVPVVLEAAAVAKRYGNRSAVSGLRLAVREGGVHGLLGPNGAGKTTLLRMVLGLLRPDEGAIHVFGRPLPTRGGLPEGVAGFAGTPSLYPYLSGRANLELLARLDDDPTAALQRVDEVLERVGLVDEAATPVAEASTGTKQRLGLAAALLRAPRLLVLDEPTSGLDPIAAGRFRAEIRRLAAQGVAVLLSSHDLAEVDALCETMTVMRDGRAVFAGSKAELRGVSAAPEHRLHTSDDAAARTLAASHQGLDVRAGLDGEGLRVVAAPDAMDDYVIALGRAGVAVRALERLEPTLESLLLRLLDGEAAS